MKKNLNIAYLNGAEGMIRRGASGGGGSSSGGGSSKPKWTGHADVEGLKAIGWTDEDIAYYQANGVNWNEEDDQYHKVPEDNIALYGVLTADNIADYKDRIVYLPKIDTSGVTDMNSMFMECFSLVSIPQLNTSSVTNMSGMFMNCLDLVSIPILDTSSVEDMSDMFSACSSLIFIPKLDTSNVTAMAGMLWSCNSLVSIPQLDTSNVTNMEFMFQQCYSLAYIPQLDTSNVTNMSNIFDNCYSLKTIKLKGLIVPLDVIDTHILTKDSLLYIINNEAATSAITITVSKFYYNRYSTDADVVAALSNHPNISLAR